MRRSFISVVFAICMLVFLSVSAHADEMKTLGFPVQSVSEEEKTDFIEKTNLKLIYDDSYKAGIKSFDVSKDGMIALAFDYDTNSHIYVYSPQGEFIYGYNFSSIGIYGIGFVEENIAIYFQRSNIVAIYDPNGNCIDVQKIVNPNLYYGIGDQIVERTSKQGKGRAYILERDVNFGETYSRFVIIEEDGTRNVMYDVSTQHSVSNILWIAGILGFVALLITIAFVKGRKIEYDTKYPR